MSDKNTRDLVEGRWEVVSIHIYTTDGKWELYTQFAKGEYWLEFAHSDNFIVANILHAEGQFIEQYRGHSTNTTYYLDAYDDGATLTIDRSTYLDDGFLDICTEEQFSIDKIHNAKDTGESLHLTMLNDPDCPPPYTRTLITRF